MRRVPLAAHAVNRVPCCSFFNDANIHLFPNCHCPFLLPFLVKQPTCKAQAIGHRAVQHLSLAGKARKTRFLASWLVIFVTYNFFIESCDEAIKVKLKRYSTAAFFPRRDGLNQ
ncbi:MAG: hypothetical protein AB7E77_00100 [Desulfobulbus sp.]